MQQFFSLCPHPITVLLAIFPALVYVLKNLVLRLHPQPYYANFR
ncbi:hypothetical protein DSUL_50250 [Desulfovibrionales bacterium]